MPFYVMDRVDGHVPVQWKPDDPVAFPSEEARRAIGLATGLEVVPVVVALEDLQRAYARYWDAGQTATLLQLPVVASRVDDDLVARCQGAEGRGHAGRPRAEDGDAATG